MITIIIIVVTAAVSVICFSQAGLFETLKFSAYDVWHRRQWHQMLTYGLVHGGWGHLLFNMITLYCFGRIVEQYFGAAFGDKGPVLYVVFYVTALIVSTIGDLIKFRDNPSYSSAETAGEFELDSYDYILDAIDSLKDKGELILRATRTPAVFFSSMGAALKIDPAQVRVAEFWNVRGCPLGAALRKRFKQNHTWPGHKFRCVYDEEVLPNRGGVGQAETELFNKAQINGSLAHITAIFGMTLAGLVIDDVYHKIAG